MKEMNKSNISSETFHVTGITAHSDELKKLASINPDWNLSPHEILASGKENQKIFRLRFISKPIELKNDPYTGALNVYVAGNQVGYIQPQETARAKEIINNHDVKNIACGIWGGQSKTIDEHGDVQLQKQGVSVTVRITYEDLNCSIDDDIWFEEALPSSTKRKPTQEFVKAKEPKKKKKSKKSLFRRWWFWVILVLIVFFILGSIGESDTTPVNENNNNVVSDYNDSSVNSNSEVSIIPERTTPVVKPLEPNGNLGDYNLQIHDFEIVKDYEGNPTILIGYTFTNNSDENASAIVSLICQAYQNGVALDTAFIIDESIYNADDSMKEIQPGASIDIKEAYVLTSETAPVEFEIGEAFAFTDELIGKTFEISAGGITELRTAPIGSISDDLGICSVSIVSYKITKDYEGKDAILFELGYTNNSDTANNYLSTVDFSAFQNGVELEMAILIDEDDADSNSTLRNVKPGAGIPVTVAYILTSNTAPVSIEIEDIWGFSGNEIKTEISIG